MDDVRLELQRSINAPASKRQAPYDKPTSVLKREVYRFVLHHRARTRDILIETAIDQYRESAEARKSSANRKVLRPLRTDFSDSQFYWVLSGLKAGIAVGEFEIEKGDVSRFAQQLVYADRHEIAPEHLIGFLYQCGSVSEIVRKAKDPNTREDWYVAMQGGGRKRGI